MTLFLLVFYSLSMYILTCLFTALIIVGSFIKVPMFPISITLQTLFIFLSALLLPLKNSLLAILLYTILGLIGLPVFTSGGGISAIFSPSFGFIIGFIFATLSGSFLAKRRHDSFIYNLFVVIVMEIIIYAFGLTFLMLRLDTTIYKALTVGFFPFIVGDLIKIVVSASSATKIYPELLKYEERIKERDNFI